VSSSGSVSVVRAGHGRRRALEAARRSRGDDPARRRRTPSGDDPPMRMLFTTAPGVGHVIPMLPVALAAVARGHEVRVGGGRDIEPIVRRAGLDCVELGLGSLVEAREQIPGIATLSGRARAVLMVREGFARILAGPMADDVLALAADWRPDVVVNEDKELGAWIAAERLGIPHVTIQTTAWRPSVQRLVVANQNALRERLGLDRDPRLASSGGQLWFTTRPAALRDPENPLPTPLRELRPTPDDSVGGDGPAAPGWLHSTTDRPRIGVTLGTVNAHRVDVLRPIVDGLADLPVDVVVGLGADPSTLGPVPPNVRVERYVAMTRLIPTCAAVVHHGGSGTMLAAAAAATPQVLLPLAADQPDNAEACVRAGIGLELAASDVTEEAVAAAADTVLSDPSFRVRAAAVAAEIRAMPDADAAVREIETVV
jgi:UDP:flavonoid glycosyltransferase YjiC (YdhE family)